MTGLTMKYGNSNEYKLGVCDVHSLVDGDDKKRIVSFCAFCDAWMCDVCSDDIAKRSAAWAIRLARKVRDEFDAS